MKSQLESLVAQMHESGITLKEGEREFKKRFIMLVMAKFDHNQCEAARALGMHRNTLARTLGELQLVVRRQKGEREIVEQIQQTVDARKPIQSVEVEERCHCTGRGWHWMHGPNCTRKRAQGAGV